MLKISAKEGYIDLKYLDEAGFWSISITFGLMETLLSLNHFTECII